MQPVKSPATWEFLEATAHNIAEMRRLDAPQLVLAEGHRATQRALRRGQVPIDPVFLAHLDLDEAAFYVALKMLITERCAEMRSKSFSDLVGRKNPFYRPTKPNFLVMIPTVVLMVVILFARGVGWQTIDAFTIFLMMLVMLFGMLPEFVKMHSHMWSVVRTMNQDLCHQAVYLTGNLPAAMTAMRKYVAFGVTHRGKAKLKGWRLYLFNLRLRSFLRDDEFVKFGLNPS